MTIPRAAILPPRLHRQSAKLMGSRKSADADESPRRSGAEDDDDDEQVHSVDSDAGHERPQGALRTMAPAADSSTTHVADPVQFVKLAVSSHSPPYRSYVGVPRTASKQYESDRRFS